MTRKIPITTQNAIIIAAGSILAVIVGWYLYTHWPGQKEEVSGVKVNINVYPNVKEDEFNKKLEALEKELSREKAEKAKALFAAGNNAFELGKKLFSLKEFDEAINKFRESLEYLPEGSELQAYVYYNLGNTYFAKSMWAEAKAAYGKCIEIGEKKTPGAVYNNLGMVFFSIDNFQEALQYLLSALKTFQQIKDHPGEGATLNNIGAVYYKQRKYPDALKHFQEALKIYQQEVVDRHSEAVMIGSIAKIREAMGEIEEAIRLMEKVVEIDKETQDPDLAVHTEYLEKLKKLRERK